MSQQPPARYDDLRAVFISCTLKRSPDPSNTEGLFDAARSILEGQGVQVEVVRPVDLPIATGVYPDMTEHGWDQDAWPDLDERVQAADIVIIGSPIWLGQHSSVCATVIERLYGSSAGAMDILYSLQHLGFTIPPQAEAAWVGEAGPGPSYLDEGSGGPDNDFTQRSITFMTWNLLHLARMLADAGGVPAYGNQVDAWQDGERFGHPGASQD